MMNVDDMMNVECNGQSEQNLWQMEVTGNHSLPAYSMSFISSLNNRFVFHTTEITNVKSQCEDSFLMRKNQFTNSS